MARLFGLMCVMCLLVAASASAQVRVVFDGCTDAQGAPVRSVEDRKLAVAFSTRIEGGAPVIRYNADVPAGLHERARLFFYAHECARLGLGFAAEALRTVGDAWRADCRALDTLLHSGLLRRDEILRLQGALELPAEMWSVVPGPQRDIDLMACARSGSARPLSLPTTRAPDQDRWNACVHRCGDALLRCQRATCGGVECPSCLPANESCVARCDVDPRPETP